MRNLLHACVKLSWGLSGPAITNTGSALMHFYFAQILMPYNAAWWPAELIDGIVTEVGVAEKGQDGKFHLGELFTS